MDGVSEDGKPWRMRCLHGGGADQKVRTRLGGLRSLHAVKHKRQLRHTSIAAFATAWLVTVVVPLQGMRWCWCAELHYPETLLVLECCGVFDSI